MGDDANMMARLVLAALALAGSYALPNSVNQDEWTEVNQRAEISKEVSATFEATFPVGSTSITTKVCAEAVVPNWMMDECIEKGLMAVFAKTEGQGVEALMQSITAATAQVQAGTVVVAQAKCDQTTTNTQIYTNTTDIPAVGEITVSVYYAQTVGTMLSQFLEANNMKPASSQLVQVSKSLSATMHGEINTQSATIPAILCVEMVVPNWMVDEECVEKGLVALFGKTGGQGFEKIINKMSEAQAKVNLNAELTYAQTPCDKEVTQTLLAQASTEVPVLGTVEVAVYKNVA